MDLCDSDFCPRSNHLFNMTFGLSDHVFFNVTCVFSGARDREHYVVFYAGHIEYHSFPTVHNSLGGHIDEISPKISHAGLVDRDHMHTSSMQMAASWQWKTFCILDSVTKTKYTTSQCQRQRPSQSPNRFLMKSSNEEFRKLIKPKHGFTELNDSIRQGSKNVQTYCKVRPIPTIWRNTVTLTRTTW